jgi:hypothetical protein
VTSIKSSSGDSGVDALVKQWIVFGDSTTNSTTVTKSECAGACENNYGNFTHGCQFYNFYGESACSSGHAECAEPSSDTKCLLLSRCDWVEESAFTGAQFYTSNQVKDVTGTPGNIDSNNVILQSNTKLPKL